MKIYLPGYYLRSLRNEPLVEINAEDIHTTIQVHQLETEKLRTNRNLKVFEEISRSTNRITVDNKIVRNTPLDVPLVQEFIRRSDDDGDNVCSEPLKQNNFSLTQTMDRIEENVDLQQVKKETCSSESDLKSQESQTDLMTSSSVTASCLKHEKVQGSVISACSFTAPQQTVYHHGIFTVSDSQFPKAFKAKLKKNLRDAVLKSPSYNAVRITNLSYSQPSTPKTPMYRSILCGTPKVQRYTNMCTPSLSQYVPFTPMLHEAVRLLDSIPEKFEENVDLLNIIDDDTKPVEMMDKELDFYNEVNDANVVDYVLNIENDYTVKEETNIFKKVQKHNFDRKRKCHRAKPVFLEESEAFKEQKRQKDRERRKKRKQMFENKSPLGTRRSKRKLRPPPRV